MRFFRLRKLRASLQERNNNAGTAAPLEDTTGHSLRSGGGPRLRLPAKQPLLSSSSSHSHHAHPHQAKRSSMAYTDPSTSQDKEDAEDDGSFANDIDNMSLSSTDDALPQQDLASYHLDDLVLGELLGQGTFSTVHAIVCFATGAPPARRRQQQQSTKTAQQQRPMFATDFALKRLHTTKRFQNYRAVVADLATEAWILHRLPHPHVLGLHAIVEDPARPEAKALVVDRLTSTLREERRRWTKWAPTGGNNTAAWRRLRPQTWRHVETMRCHVAVDLSAALQHLHAHRICHRDIKPSNVGFDAVRENC